jgi:hypothetical protein
MEETDLCPVLSCVLAFPSTTAMIFRFWGQMALFHLVRPPYDAQILRQHQECARCWLLLCPIINTQVVPNWASVSQALGNFCPHKEGDKQVGTTK